MARIDTDALLSRIRLSDVVRRRTKLTKAGRHLRGLCPIHSERTPSFYVYDHDGGFHCYGCGANGDAIGFLMLTERIDFRAACEMLANGDLPVVTEAERAQAAEEDARIRAAAIEEARGLWRDAVGVAGAAVGLPGRPAAAYLQSRGIEIRPDRFRFAMTPSWRNYETGECGPDRPALICLVTDLDDNFLGVQRVFLAPDGSGKARDMRNAKLSLGRPAGGAVRLGPAVGSYGADHVIVVEGPEDGATVSQMRPDQPVWVTCGTGMMPQLQFPPEVRRVTIGGDNNKSGRAAAQKAKEAYQDRGLEVRCVYPDPEFADWNDQLRGIRMTK